MSDMCWLSPMKILVWQVRKCGSVCVCVWLRDGRHEAPTPPPTVITTLLWITWQLRGRSMNSVSGGGTCSAAAEVFSAPRTAQSNCAQRERFLSTEGFVLIFYRHRWLRPNQDCPHHGEFLSSTQSEEVSVKRK